MFISRLNKFLEFLTKEDRETQWQHQSPYIASMWPPDISRHFPTYSFLCLSSLLSVAVVALLLPYISISFIFITRVRLYLNVVALLSFLAVSILDIYLCLLMNNCHRNAWFSVNVFLQSCCFSHYAHHSHSSPLNSSHVRRQLLQIISIKQYDTMRSICSLQRASVPSTRKTSRALS